MTIFLVKCTGCRRNLSKSDQAQAAKGFGVQLPKGFSVHGIDVSKHQGNIDWLKVSKARSGETRIDFVFIKATEGITRHDEKFRQNWQQAANSGLIRGAYHYFYPSRDPLEQAANFIKMVKLKPGDLPPVVDIEHTNGMKAAEICKSLRIFTDELQRHYKTKPLIYTNVHYYNSILKKDFDEYPLWISCYFGHERFYAEFAEPWMFWQHSERGRINGINGRTDLNVFCGSEKDLLKLCLH